MPLRHATGCPRLGPDHAVGRLPPAPLRCPAGSASPPHA